VSVASPLLHAPGIAPPTRCIVVKEHRPRPLRFVYHHVLPQTCGGKTVPDNLAALCDTCHYAVHALLWKLAHGLEMPEHVSTGQLAIAARGYKAAVEAGTVARIPNEGSATA
jgi:hypothetical protein